jgi:micrococcal nuclease
MKRFRVSLSTVLTLIFFFVAAAQTVEAQSGKVVGVSDGDTITLLIDRIPGKVRLYGIDWPENSQNFGTRAKQFASEMVLEKSLPWKCWTPTDTADP